MNDLNPNKSSPKNQDQQSKKACHSQTFLLKFAYQIYSTPNAGVYLRFCKV